MRAAGPGPSTKPLLIADMEAPFVRLVLVGAAVGAATGALLMPITRDPGMLAAMITSTVTAIVAAVMVRMERERLVIALIPGWLGLVTVGALTRLDYARLFVVLAVVFVGLLAVVFMSGRTVSFLVLYVGLLFAANVIWHGLGATGVVEGAIMSGIFLSGASGVEWIRDRMTDTASRFLNLFQRAPVSLWEEDFTKVGKWLEGLRARGVTDLRGYLAANREVFLEGMHLIDVVRVNSEAARFLEVDDPRNLVGPLRAETFPDDAMPSMVAQFEAIWEGKDQVTVEVHHGYTTKGRSLDGLLHWVVPHRSGEPDLSRVLVSVVDVTEMNNTRRRLEQSVRSKDELIATVSHELRTPLTTVVGLSAELSDYYEDFSVEEVKELLKLVSDQSNEAAAIVEDLLVAARAESGSLRVAFAPVDLHLETRTTLRGLDVEQDVDCNTVGIIPMVFADSVRVRQIIRNLLVNARRYGVPPVRVVVRNAGEEVCVEVRDQGCELPDEEVVRVFERYYRARQIPGVTASAGLGLTVSRELARAMGGDLTYHHDGESVFTLKLPVPAADEQAATA